MRIGLRAAIVTEVVLMAACGGIDDRIGPASETTPTEPPTSVSSSVPPSTSPPTSSSSSSDSETFEIGDDIELSNCTPVVPPSRSSAATLLRLACPGLPDDIQFADVSVADPDVDVPSMGTQIDVEGEIVDVVKSEVGFTTILVAAESVSTG